MAREVQQKVTSEEKLECMLDCIYKTSNQGDLPWYEVSVHIRDKLKPFLKLVKEMKLLTEGEIVIKNEKGKDLYYKGSLYNGKAFGLGKLTDHFEEKKYLADRVDPI